MKAKHTKGPLRVVIDGTCSAAWPTIVQDCVTPETGEKWTFEVGRTETCFVETAEARNSSELPGTYSEAPHRFRAHPEHDESVANAFLFAAANELLDSIYPDTLEAVADEIDCFKHSARAGSLRVLARLQRAAIAKAKGEAA